MTIKFTKLEGMVKSTRERAAQESASCKRRLGDTSRHTAVCSIGPPSEPLLEFGNPLLQLGILARNGQLSCGVTCSSATLRRRPYRARSLSWNRFGNLWLFGGKHVEGHDHAQRNMLLHVAVELPDAREVGLKADNGPRTLPQLERVLEQRSRQVLRHVIRFWVIGAAPVEVLDATRMVVITELALGGWTRIELLRHEKAGRFIHVAPLIVGHVDHLKQHAMHMDIVRRGAEVIENDLHSRGVLRDVQDWSFVGATLVLGVECWRQWLLPGVAAPVNVHVPATAGEWCVRRAFVQRPVEAQIDCERHVSLRWQRLILDRSSLIPVGRVGEVERDARDRRKRSRTAACAFDRGGHLGAEWPGLHARVLEE